MEQQQHKKFPRLSGAIKSMKLDNRLYPLVTEWTIVQISQIDMDNVGGNRKSRRVFGCFLENPYVCFSLVQEQTQPKEAATGKIGGFDFGLKTFLLVAPPRSPTPLCDK
jgi:transposase